jgi:hypothetical protein
MSLLNKPAIIFCAVALSGCVQTTPRYNNDFFSGIGNNQPRPTRPIVRPAQQNVVNVPSVSTPVADEFQNNTTPTSPVAGSSVESRGVAVEDAAENRPSVDDLDTGPIVRPEGEPYTPDPNIRVILPNPFNQ